jgi:hypothetical protein
MRVPGTRDWRSRTGPPRAESAEEAMPGRPMRSGLFLYPGYGLSPGTVYVVADAVIPGLPGFNGDGRADAPPVDAAKSSALSHRSSRAVTGRTVRCQSGVDSRREVRSPDR